jgi:hypothetical protein
MLSYIPIRPGTKKPAIEWHQYMETPATPSQVEAWKEVGPMGLVTGKVSDNLEVIDFDVAELFRPWADEIGDLFEKLTVVQTSKGFHVYYYCDKIGRNQVLAKRKLDGKAKIETRAEGGYVVTPSPQDDRYVFLCGDHGSIPTITEDERELMFCVARTYCEKPKVFHGKNRVPGKPGDDYNEKAPPWEEILTEAGWTFVRERSDGISEWRRPGKTDMGISATVGVHGKDILYVFSSSVENLDPGAYNKFSYLAHTEYGGDFTECAKALAAQGYGEKQTPKDNSFAKIFDLGLTFETFKGKDGVAHAYVEGKGVMPVQSSIFSGTLMLAALEKGIVKAPNPSTFERVTNALNQIILASGDEREIFARVGFNRDEDAVYVDLGYNDTRAVKITKAGWEIVDEPNVYFCTQQRRTPLPEPRRGGSLDDLRGLINAKDIDDYYLIIAWMINCFNPYGAFPLLVIHGGASAAKTFGTRFIRKLVDPSDMLPTLTKPTSVENMMQVAFSNYVMAYDNLSGISNALSDAMCQLSTGSGFATRKLYTNMDLVVYDCKRPVILNGIDQLARREDFGSRALVIEFPKFKKGKRKDDKLLIDQLEERTPKFLGAMYDAVALALDNYNHVQIDDFDSRLQDFCKWTVAAMGAFPKWDRDKFRAAMQANEDHISEDLMTLNPVTEYTVQFMQNKDEWEGTPAELLEKLTGLVPPALARSKDWPKSAAALSFKLNRGDGPLAKQGIKMERIRGPKTRTVKLTNENPTDN